jgi:hypothetical protein
VGATAGDVGEAGEVATGLGVGDWVAGSDDRAWSAGRAGPDDAASVGAVPVGVAPAGAVPAGAGAGLEETGVGSAGAVRALERPTEPPCRSFSTPPMTESFLGPLAWAGLPASFFPSAAWEAGTPAENTSIAPRAAAAAPRRSPPRVLVLEREARDL